MNDSVEKQKVTCEDRSIGSRGGLRNVVSFPSRRAGGTSASQELEIGPTDAEMIREWLLEIRDLTVRIEVVLGASQRNRR